ncbi:aminotransferase class I/II-fold pyridoxal phosphate-dependent enzyme [Cohnella thailandensis]|uniref:Aminotransferase n=1 Tax=Cohnella thailandensis TaxID=557557 RepID=A0A841T075_9BACL|nr:aminotransferase class I/II-fold pyridoxal phosphate-dependent enzyme [Cohnella thailandensis]MBB6636932.1 aminotransferase class I/II-fold pyridoxal phosphate-dependent enzyme [Cohnella thailandensis]MBP1973186.1 aminotransferase [Cohnella thailandensis]
MAKQLTYPTIRERMNPIVRDIPPSGIRKFFDLLEGRKEVISLGVGEPDFATPASVREACIRALEQGRTSYTSNAGMPELREAIAEYLSEEFGVGYSPEQEILVTVGSSEAIDLALRTLICPGDEILIPVPCYISYSPITSLGMGVTVPVETEAKDGFKLTVEALKAKLTPRTKVLILCYPNNPTGATMTYEEWLPISRFVEENDLIVIADEIYAELTYEGKPTSFASLPGMKDRTLLVSGFSKAFAMTGWRVGYVCGHRELIGAMLKIHQYTVMCAPILGQIAAIESLKNGREEKERMIESYDRRRKLFVEGLRQIGLPCLEPRGAFYAFPSIASTGLTSVQFAERLLNEANVVTVPGDVFGAGGEGHIRCTYAASPTQLNEALERMDKWLRSFR